MTGENLDYSAIIGGADAGDTGVEHSAILIELADAMLDTDDERLAAARRSISDAMGSAALVDCVAVAALFNGIDRIADATGAPLEKIKADSTVDLRSEIGIDAFGAQKEALDAAEIGSAAE